MKDTSFTLWTRDIPQTVERWTTPALRMTSQHGHNLAKPYPWQTEWSAVTDYGRRPEIRIVGQTHHRTSVQGAYFPNQH